MVPPLDVSPIDKEAQRDLQVLYLQVVTQREIKEALSDVSQDSPFIDNLIAFIRKWVARQNLHYCL
jgi:hypothetical protein